MFLNLLFKKKNIDEKYVTAIVLAAGNGTRMNSDIKKQFISVYNKPILAYTLEKFQMTDIIDEIIVVTGCDDIVLVSDIVKEFRINKVSKIIEGGQRRQDSVFEGLKEVAEECEIVAIHDGARPNIKPVDIEKVVLDAIEYKAAILGVKSKDTIKKVDSDNFVVDTPNRDELFLIQTPQVFKKDLLIDAYNSVNESGLSFTDDSGLVENMGFKVKITEGSYDNIKITTIEDLIVFEGGIVND